MMPFIFFFLRSFHCSSIEFKKTEVKNRANFFLFFWSIINMSSQLHFTKSINLSCVRVEWNHSFSSLFEIFLIVRDLVDITLEVQCNFLILGFFFLSLSLIVTLNRVLHYTLFHFYYNVLMYTNRVLFKRPS